jgi:hypothetical protein
MEKYKGDTENTPLSEILKALGYAYKDCRYSNPSLGKKEIYKDDPAKQLVEIDDILFVGGACQTWDWLVETGQVEGKKHYEYSVLEECHVEKNILCDCKQFGTVPARKKEAGEWASKNCGKVPEYTPEGA